MLGAGLGAVVFGTANLWLSQQAGLARSIEGAVAGGILAVELYKRSAGITERTGARFALPFAVGVAVGRIGCFFAGLDDFTYGYPRTYQLDQDVGHFGRVSHFLCLNLNGEIEMIETQKGHPEVAKIYVVMVLPADQASVPVTISFQNIKGYGSVDAIIHYGSTEIPLYNNGTTFQSQPPTK